MKKLLLILMIVSAVMGQANHTGWPLELLSWNVNKAYPGIEYNYRLGVKGGEYPYRFYLRHGPTGMIVDSTGALIWTPASATTDSVRVVVKDQLNDSLVVEYGITATTTGFYFVDSATGSNSNTGTEDSPWLTMAYAAATADSSEYVYVKKGTYSETFNMTVTGCGRFIAYGDSVKIIGAGTGTASFSPVGSNRLWQGFEIDGRGLRWIFSISGEGCQKMIFRKNEMYNVMDTTSMNPAFLFFWNQVDPYLNIVIQDNVFHGLVDKKVYHGASVSSYDMQNSLYENNHVYDIDGRGVNEKLDGKRNTFRANIFHDIEGYQAIVLSSNPNSDSTEICYNHIYDCPVGGFLLGLNASYVSNIFVHHNTFKSYVTLANTGGVTNSNNINIYKNIIGLGLDYPYSLGGWPTDFKTKVDIDSNIIYGRVDSTRVSGSGKTLSLLQWRDSTFDINSPYMQLTYDANNIPILSDSLLNIYGHLANSFAESEPAAPVITVQPHDSTVTDGATVSFSVTAINATGYQWYGNGSLISGATNSTYSFTATLALTGSSIYCLVYNATDTISTDTVTLTVNAIPAKTPATITQQPVSDTVTAGQSATFFVTASGSGLTYQWFRNDSLVTGATNDTFTYTSRSGLGYTDTLYCNLTTDTTISTDTVTLSVFQRAPVHTGWPLELLSWNVNKAYPGIEYNYRLGVKGGEYPYTFALRHGPTGMIVDSTGALIWTPPGATTDSVRVVVKDLRNDSLVVQYNITATTSGFYFVDSATGSNSNTGTEDSPWLTMAYASATADSASYVYVKKGTYTISEKISLAANNCGRFFAYPGDSVIVKGAGTGTSSFGVKGENRIFQGFTFDGNGLKWLFSVSDYAKNLIWRKNIMHNNGSTDRENPAFIFFWDGSGNPIKGQGGYNNVVIQDNILYDLNDTVSYHCSSVTSYDVQNMLYEDNIAHDIDGNGVDDKDMGHMNTFRNNVIYNCVVGIGLLSQGGNSGIEVNYNHIYNCKEDAIIVGLQAGDINNIFIHHNTFKGAVRMYEYVIAREGSTNINIYKNIIGNGSNFPYVFEPSGDANYPQGFRTKVLIDSNIVFGKSDSTNIAGETWGIYKLNWKQWQDSGKDVNSKAMQLTYDANNIPILSDSLLNIYGHLANSFAEGEPAKTPATITQQPVSDTVIAGQSATFFVTASGSGLTYQWYRNDSLLAGENNDTLTYTSRSGSSYIDNLYCNLTTDTMISTDTVTLTVNAIPLPVISQSTDTLKLVTSPTNYDSLRWFDNDIATDSTDSTYTIYADSAFYSIKHVIYCIAYNSGGSVKSGEWVFGIWGTLQSRWQAFKSAFKSAYKTAWR